MSDAGSPYVITGAQPDREHCFWCAGKSGGPLEVLLQLTPGIPWTLHFCHLSTQQRMAVKFQDDILCCNW